MKKGQSPEFYSLFLEVVPYREGFKKKVIIINFGGEGGQRGSFTTYFFFGLKMLHGVRPTRRAVQQTQPPLQLSLHS